MKNTAVVLPLGSMEPDVGESVGVGTGGLVALEFVVVSLPHVELVPVMFV